MAKKRKSSTGGKKKRPLNPDRAKKANVKFAGWLYAKITQGDRTILAFSESAGFPYATVSGWCNATSKPGVGNLARLASGLASWTGEAITLETLIAELSKS